MKYAFIENNIVKVISYQPLKGFIEVDDNVYADMIRQSDGSFDYTADYKKSHTISLSQEARDKRDRLLAESDWVTIRAMDTGNPVPTEWQTYRQALRDVPQQTGFPENIEWPEKPE